MRRNLACLACAVAIAALPSAAWSASITIYFALASWPQYGQEAEYHMLADVEAGARLGAVDLVAVGFTSLSIDPLLNPNISLVDSKFVANVYGDERASIIVSNGLNGQAIAAGPATGVYLGTLTSPYAIVEYWEPPIPLAVFDDPFYFGGAIYDDYLRLVTDGEVLQPENNGYEPPADWVHPGVPEPAAGALAALLGVAMSALAAARWRCAS